MKRVFSAIFCLFLLISTLAVSASANAQTQYICDQAELLDRSEIARLSQEAKSLRSQYGLDVVIVTTDSTYGSSPRAYAEDFYDSMGYADNGILFLLSMEERDWYICTSGRARDIFSSKGIDRMGDEIVPHLSDGDYYSGFLTFLDLIPSYIEAYNEGIAPEAKFDLTLLLVSLGIGLLVGLIAILIMRSGMATARQRHGATEYVKQGTFDLRLRQDFFLYSRVHKAARSNSNGPGGRGGGGGRSHGGGGGKF